MAPELRPNVCIILLNREGKLFLGERLHEPDHWQFPQGGVDEGGSLEETVLREVHEEVGVEPGKLRIIRRLHATHSYEWDSVRTYEGREYRGQSQTFWLVEFLGDDQDIDLQVHEQEFQRWQWVNPKEALALVSPVRRSGYELPVTEVLEYLSEKYEPK
ncbi:MAG: NUDIX domain-containing protein [Bdellovibrionota bacterium]